MTEESAPDIVDQIDALAEPGDDAATVTATGGHEIPEWNKPSPGNMTAVLLDMSRAAVVEISQADPGQDLARLVGDPFFNRIRHLATTTFWVGDNSEANAPLNQPATRFLHELLSDVQDGAYVASDTERQHVRQLLAHRDGVPVIHGPCLITGADTAGEPGPLSENFQNWFTALLKKAAQLRDEIGQAIADTLGIPADMLDRITIIGLD